MSTSEENTEIIIPCVLITSCDTGFKEEELIKREFNEPEVNVLANCLTLNKANSLLAQKKTFVCTCMMLLQLNNPFVSCCQASYVAICGAVVRGWWRLRKVTFNLFISFVTLFVINN